MLTFDVDGTLVRRYPGVKTLKVEAIDHAFAEVFGIRDFNYFDYLKPEMYGLTDKSIMKLLLHQFGVSKSQIDNKIDSLLELAVKFFTSHSDYDARIDYYILPGVENLLGKLKDRGLTMGIATGNYGEFAWWKLKGVGIGDYFTFGGFGEDAEDRSEIVGIARSRGGLDSSRACHFGDTPIDIKAAHANGMLAAAISDSGGATFDSDTLREAGADLVIDSYNDVDGILEFLESQS